MHILFSYCNLAAKTLWKFKEKVCIQCNVSLLRIQAKTKLKPQKFAVYGIWKANCFFCLSWIVLQLTPFQKRGYILFPARLALRELYPSYGRSFDHTDEQIECDLTIWNPQVRILWRNDAHADSPFGTVILYGLSKMSVDFYKNHTISSILHNFGKSKEKKKIIKNAIRFSLQWNCHFKILIFSKLEYDQ